MTPIFAIEAFNLNPCLKTRKMLIAPMRNLCQMALDYIFESRKEENISILKSTETDMIPTVIH